MAHGAVRDEVDLEREFAIQRSLLMGTVPQSFPGVAIACLARPSAGVHGDFYDFLEFSDERCLDVVLGDVMGKGLSAALTAAGTRGQFQTSFRTLQGALQGRRLPHPSEVLTDVDLRMGSLLMGMNCFVTLFYGRFDLAFRRLSYVDRGHMKTLHVPAAGGEGRFLHGVNLPMGVEAGDVLVETVAPFEPGDSFLIYSDGLLEARGGPQGRAFGEERLRQLAAGARRGTPVEWLREIVEGLEEYTGGQLPGDDLTLIALRIDPELAQERISRHGFQIHNRLEDVRWLRKTLRRTLIRDRVMHHDPEFLPQLELAVAEVATNIVEHGGAPGSDSPVAVELEVAADGVLVSFVHHGECFSPPTVTPPSLTLSPDGGLGLYLLSRTMDWVSYARDPAGRSLVSMARRFRPGD